MQLNNVTIKHGVAFLEPRTVILKGYGVEDLDANRDSDFLRGLKMRLEYVFRVIPYGKPTVILTFISAQMPSTNLTSKRFTRNNLRLPYPYQHRYLGRVPQDPIQKTCPLRGHVPLQRTEPSRRSLRFQIASCVHLLWTMNNTVVRHRQRTILDNPARQRQPVTPHLPPHHTSGHKAPPWSPPWGCRRPELPQSHWLMTRRSLAPTITSDTTTSTPRFSPAQLASWNGRK